MSRSISMTCKEATQLRSMWCDSRQMASFWPVAVTIKWSLSGSSKWRQLNLEKLRKQCNGVTLGSSEVTLATLLTSNGPVILSSLSLAVSMAPQSSGTSNKVNTKRFKHSKVIENLFKESRSIPSSSLLHLSHQTRQSVSTRTES